MSSTVLDAAHSVVHDYPGGAEALATRLKMASSTLRSQVNVNANTHVFGLKTAVTASQLTGDPRILFAFASELGYVCMPGEGIELDVSPLMAVSQLMAAHGDVGQVVHEALSDGRISSAEQDAIEDAIAANIQRLHALQNAVRAARRKGGRCD
ncbi:Gp65 protein [Pseudogulbenkiania sp. NH8B]|uniref:phage regulatory CII family protein n=1 Tax=Pseudogulbenkiania sp. (strain NH8B) TaxID=748280 RepID=UPI0002279A88|nr:phage regulatory CII family protein [Pseudogulbenkiania sp. NH8B]BAK75802.1 Gp65 protein [Pseudogulbenkiania sp. NH8B]